LCTTTLICTPSKKLYSFFWAFSLATSHGKEEAPASSTGTPASLSLLIPAHCAKLPSGMVYFQAKFNDIVAKLKCTHLQPHKRLLQTPGEGDVEVKACLGKASSSSGMLLMLGWRDNEASWKEQSYYHCSKYGKMNPCRCPIQYCHLPTIPTISNFHHHLLKLILIRQLNILRYLSTSLYCVTIFFFPLPPPCFSNIKLSIPTCMHELSRF